MTRHRLDPLLSPNSIALIGASDRTGSPGHILADMIIHSNYAGAVYPVNPRCKEILNQPCYDYLESLPATVDHAIIALGNQHLESALNATIEHGTRAATIYASATLEKDSDPKLLQRLSDMARAAGMMICGPNGMGFYNVSQDLFAGIFPRSTEILRGEISYIAQSGSAFATLCHNGCRLGFNLCVSTGSEIATTVADYMDWCLDQSDTRVIGLFLETVRDPEAFVAALEKAGRNNIPVVVLKIGKSPLGAAMALTHTGAIAGNQAVYSALFKKYGVIEVSDFDEMAAILMLLQTGRETAEGGFAAAFESGGFRELATDQAHELGVHFAPLNEATIQALTPHLEPGLVAENPLDVWGSHDRFEERFQACMSALIQDSNVAGGAFVSNFRDDYFLSEAIYRSVEAINRQTSKPIALVNCYSDLANSAICRRAHAAGLPVIDGTHRALLAFKHLFDYHKFKAAQRPDSPARVEFDTQRISTWKRKLATHESDSLDEPQALALLGDFSIPVVRHEWVSNQAELTTAAASIGYPLVIKTAEPGIHHKSDRNGVFVNVQSEQELVDHYVDLSNRLGPRALLSQMIEQGIEIALGTVNDKQFGPVLMVAAGGLLVELLSDRAVAMCPVNAQHADAMITSLKANQLLKGVRGNAASNRQALIEIIVGLSALAYEFRDCIAEIDINPVLVNEQTAIAVDALIATHPN